MTRRRCFQRHSWADLLYIYDHSSYRALDFPHSPNSYCLPLSSTKFGLTIFRHPVTFHPRKWSIAWLRCPVSRVFPLDSDPLYLALSEQISLTLPALSFPLSPIFGSVALASILKTLLLE